MDELGAPRTQGKAAELVWEPDRLSDMTELSGLLA
jgi:hypothetical protein